MMLESLVIQLLNYLMPPRSPATVPGIELGRTTGGAQTPVVWPDRFRREHLVAVGKTGTGKTYALERIAFELGKRGEGFAFFDFHGDASLTLISRLLPLPRSGHRLVVLDPAHPILSAAINVLDADTSQADRFRRVSELSSILRQRWGMESFGARTEELLRNCLYTLTSTHRTLADLPRLLADASLRSSLIEGVDHPDVLAYWRERYEPLSDAMKAVFREPLLNKVTAFLAEPGARHLLGQPQSTIRIPELIERGAWFIIRLPKGELREHAHTLGNLLFAQLQFAVMARGRLAVGARSTFSLLCDEAQNLAENVSDLSTLLAEGRKFGISVVTANQFWEQLPKELRGALMSVASLICFRVSSADAQVLGTELGPDQRNRHVKALTELGRGEALARFGNTSPVTLKVTAMSSAVPVSQAQLDQLIAATARPRVEIEAALRRSRAAPLEHRPTTDEAADPGGWHGW